MTDPALASAGDIHVQQNNKDLFIQSTKHMKKNKKSRLSTNIKLLDIVSGYFTLLVMSKLKSELLLSTLGY